MLVRLLKPLLNRVTGRNVDEVEVDVKYYYFRQHLPSLPRNHGNVGEPVLIVATEYEVHREGFAERLP